MKPPSVWLLVAPQIPPTGGNRISAERLAARLAERGWRASVRRADAPGEPPRGAVIHALHALHCGAAGRELARRAEGPLVVTLTGTDINEATPELRASLTAADVVVAYHAAARDRLLAALPGLGTPVEVITPGVECPDAAPRRRRRWGWGRGEVAFLLAGGLRPVKDPGFALAPLARLRREGVRLRLAVAGPARDDATAAELLRRLADLEWASYLGEVEHAQMAGLYRACDVALNTSRSEGLSNALLEAMACGRAVIASDIEGNRAAVRHGIDGLLYRDADDFYRWARRLCAEPGLRRRLGRNAAVAVRRRFDPQQEAAAHDALYRRLLAKRGLLQAACR